MVLFRQFMEGLLDLMISSLLGNTKYRIRVQWVKVMLSQLLSHIFVSNDSRYNWIRSNITIGLWIKTLVIWRNITIAKITFVTCLGRIGLSWRTSWWRFRGSVCRWNFLSWRTPLSWRAPFLFLLTMMDQLLVKEKQSKPQFNLKTKTDHSKLIARTLPLSNTLRDEIKKATMKITDLVKLP